MKAHEQLVAVSAFGDLAAKVQFVTLYHLVLEATLGLTTFNFANQGSLQSGRDCCPGSWRGFSKIHHDETRHIGYGVWFLREKPLRLIPIRPML